MLYPIWKMTGAAPPDNHIAKVARIRRLARRYSCQTFVETGTFYGQTVAAAGPVFSKVLSCELSDELFELNRRAFDRNPNVHIFHGDSSALLEEMIRHIDGRALFWLDGHYSGPGTALGSSTSPASAELRAIGHSSRRDHCILIDDIRLFTGLDGYPHVHSIQSALAEINPEFDIRIEGDCMVAAPSSL
jgi:hypothetical protein